MDSSRPERLPKLDDLDSVPDHIHHGLPRLRALGYRIVYTPFAELYHYEGATFGNRERSVNPAEVAAFSARWGAVIEHDPFYTPNLTRASLTYDLRI